MAMPAVVTELAITISGIKKFAGNFLINGIIFLVPLPVSSPLPFGLPFVSLSFASILDLGFETLRGARPDFIGTRLAGRVTLEVSLFAATVTGLLLGARLIETS